MSEKPLCGVDMFTCADGGIGTDSVFPKSTRVTRLKLRDRYPFNFFRVKKRHRQEVGYVTVVWSNKTGTWCQWSWLSRSVSCGLFRTKRSVGRRGVDGPGRIDFPGVWDLLTDIWRRVSHGEPKVGVHLLCREVRGGPHTAKEWVRRKRSTQKSL